MKHQIPHMLKNGNGAIVNISSMAGLVGFPTIPIYCASKHAVIGLTKSLVIEYASQGIRINAICPGGIETDMIGRLAQSNPLFIENLSKMHPMQRLGTPLEIAHAVLWLLSNKSSFVTGDAFPVDGGYAAQ